VDYKYADAVSGIASWSARCTAGVRDTLCFDKQSIGAAGFDYISYYKAEYNCF